VSFRGRPKAESRNLFDSAFGLAQDKPVEWAVARSRHGPQVPPLGPNGPSVGMTRWGALRSLGWGDKVGGASLPQREDTQKCHSEGGQRPIRGICELLRTARSREKGHPSRD